MLMKRSSWRSKKIHTLVTWFQKANMEMMKWIKKRSLHYLNSTKNWWKNGCCLESFHPSPTTSTASVEFVNPLHASRLLERTCNTFERGNWKSPKREKVGSLWKLCSHPKKTFEVWCFNLLQILDFVWLSVSKTLSPEITSINGILTRPPTPTKKSF